MSVFPRLALAITAIVLPGLVAAAPLTYLTQERWVGAITFDDFPNAAITSPDFGLFDESQSSSGYLSGDYAYARQASGLAANELTADLYSQVFSGAFDHGQAVARSIFDVTFSLTEGQAFSVAGQLTTGVINSAVGDTVTFLLETGSGTEIDLDWVDQGTTAGVDQALDSVVYLAAGSYHLRIETEASMYCLDDCGFWDDSRAAQAEFVMTAVPVPPALALFPSALALLAWVRRRAA